jgi:hypothetical protein
MRGRILVACLLILLIPALSYRFIEECPKQSSPEERDQCYYQVAPIIASKLPMEAPGACASIESALTRDRCNIAIIKFIVLVNQTGALEICDNLKADRSECFDGISPYFSGTGRIRFLYWSDPSIIIMGVMSIPLLIFILGVIYIVFSMKKSSEEAEVEEQRQLMYEEYIPPGGSGDQFQQFWYEGGSSMGGDEISFTSGETITDPSQQMEGFKYQQ